jgi:hypothetical protein
LPRKLQGWVVPGLYPALRVRRDKCCSICGISGPAEGRQTDDPSKSGEAGLSRSLVEGKFLLLPRRSSSQRPCRRSSSSHCPWRPFASQEKTHQQDEGACRAGRFPSHPLCLTSADSAGSVGVFHSPSWVTSPPPFRLIINSVFLFNHHLIASLELRVC